MASVTVRAPPEPRTAIWDRPARRALAPTLASPSSIQTKALKSGSTGALNEPPSGSSTSRISPGVPSSTGEPGPTSVRTIASPSGRRRQLFRLDDLGGRRDVLVRAREVHPEEHAPELAGLALAKLIGPDVLCVVHAAASPDLQEATRLKLGPLERPARARAVTGARDAREDVPEVVEPAMGVGRVELGAVRVDRDRGLVDQDVGIAQLVWHVACGYGLEHLEAHHRPHVGVLDEDRLAFGCLGCGCHDLAPSGLPRYTCDCKHHTPM